MNEEQEKPNEKRSGPWSLMFFSILLLVTTLAAYAFYVTNCEWHEWGDTAYITTREQLQNAVALYAANHNGSYPTFNGTYTNANCADCSVINISALLTANGGLLQHAPDGLNLSASSNDNCGGNASLGCRNGNSYIWIIATNNGSVYSYCAGAKCKTNNSGDQDVWP